MENTCLYLTKIINVLFLLLGTNIGVRQEEAMAWDMQIRKMPETPQHEEKWTGAQSAILVLALSMVAWAAIGGVIAAII